MIGRPEAGEYAEYYGRYVSQVSGDDVLAELQRQKLEVAQLLRSVPADRETYRYAPEKWSVREVVGHVNDAERVFAYRALSFARGDASPLPGFDEKDWMKEGAFAGRPLADLAMESENLRSANLALFRGFPPEAWMRSGIASDARMSVRAIAYVIAGHTAHHLRVLREKYLERTHR